MSTLSEIKLNRNREIISRFNAGVRVQQLVKDYSITKQSVYTILKKEQNPATKKAMDIVIRNNEIKEKYVAGTPMTELAQQYQLTRQGIQLILKGFDLSAKDGGASVRALVKKKKLDVSKKEKKEKICLKRWGCTLNQWEELRAYDSNFHKTPIARYIQHRSNVQRDNIPWRLELWDWWILWKNSGVYDQRGRGQNGYCMTRKGDKGPYSVDNVYITTIANNLKDGFVARLGRRQKQILKA